MTWRAANAALAIGSAVALAFCVALWIAATVGGFIGSTTFIGHVSMLALVLASASMVSGYLAAWRSDVPTDEDDED